MKKNSKLIKLTTSLALGSLLTLGLTACSQEEKSSQKTEQSSKQSSAKKQTKKAVKQNETKLKTTKIDLGQTEALDKFDKQFPDKSIKSIDLKPDGNNYVYEIEGFDKEKEYTVTINAKNGEILRSHSEALDIDEQNEKSLNLNNIIDRNEATKIAEKHAGGTAKEWKLEQDGNTAYWEVKVSDGTNSQDVKINAHKKDIVETERDDDE